MSEQPTPAERPVEPIESAPVESAPVEPAAATTEPQPAVVDAPPPAPAPVYAAAPAAPPVVKGRRGWLPYLAVGLEGVLVGILLTCTAGLLVRVAWDHHHGFDGGPGRHAPFENRRPGPGFGDGGPFGR